MQTQVADTLLEDQQIMRDITLGCAEALQKLHARYRTILKSVIHQILYDDSEGDDVVQDVLLQVWKRPTAYCEKKGRLLNWICTLAKRRAIDRLRQRSAYRRATDRYEVSRSHRSEERGHNRIVENDAIRHELSDILVAHLSRLPYSQEQAIRMAFLENRSQREISVLTGTPLGTVKTRIELGMKKLLHSFAGSSRGDF